MYKIEMNSLEDIFKHLKDIEQFLPDTKKDKSDNGKKIRRLKNKNKKLIDFIDNNYSF